MPTGRLRGDAFTRPRHYIRTFAAPSRPQTFHLSLERAVGASPNRYVGAEPPPRVPTPARPSPTLPLLSSRPPSSTRADAALWSTGHFASSVYPDLPVAPTLKGLVESYLTPTSSRRNESSAASTHPAPTPSSPSPSPAAPDPGYVVRTVACQCQSHSDYRTAVLQALASPSFSTPRISSSSSSSSSLFLPAADAILVVGGGHPLRRAVGSRLARSLWLPAEKGIRSVYDMRQNGEISPHVQIWAVGNPHIDDPAWMAAKVHAGADVLLTQPTLAYRELGNAHTHKHIQHKLCLSHTHTLSLSLSFSL